MSLQSQNKRDLWKEVRRITGKRNSFVNTMDGQNGSEAISNLFAGKYNDLYNSVS